MAEEKMLLNQAFCCGDFCKFTINNEKSSITFLGEVTSIFPWEDSISIELGGGEVSFDFNAKEDEVLVLSNAVAENRSWKSGKSDAN
jgi:hypothetical protein